MSVPAALLGEDQTRRRFMQTLAQMGAAVGAVALMGEAAKGAEPDPIAVLKRQLERRRLTESMKTLPITLQTGEELVLTNRGTADQVFWVYPKEGDIMMQLHYVGDQQMLIPPGSTLIDPQGRLPDMPCVEMPMKLKRKDLRGKPMGSFVVQLPDTAGVPIAVPQGYVYKSKSPGLRRIEADTLEGIMVDMKDSATGRDIATPNGPVSVPSSTASEADIIDYRRALADAIVWKRKALLPGAQWLKDGFGKHGVSLRFDDKTGEVFLEGLERNGVFENRVKIGPGASLDIYEETQPGKWEVADIEALGGIGGSLLRWTILNSGIKEKMAKTSTRFDVDPRTVFPDRS